MSDSVNEAIPHWYHPKDRAAGCPSDTLGGKRVGFRDMDELTEDSKPLRSAKFRIRQWAQRTAMRASGWVARTWTHLKGTT